MVFGMMKEFGCFKVCLGESTNQGTARGIGHGTDFYLSCEHIIKGDSSQEMLVLRDLKTFAGLKWFWQLNKQFDGQLYLSFTSLCLVEQYQGHPMKTQH